MWFLKISNRSISNDACPAVAEPVEVSLSKLACRREFRSKRMYRILVVQLKKREAGPGVPDFDNASP